MTVLNLVRRTAAASCLMALAACSSTSPQATAPAVQAQTVKFQQIRNATIKLDYAGTTFLIDPMLAPERSRIISMVVASTPCSLKQARAAWRMSSLREGRPMNVL